MRGQQSSDRQPDSNQTVATIERLNRRITERFSDSGLNGPGVMVTLNELKNLTAGLSRKIWQKIMIQNKLKGQCLD